MAVHLLTVSQQTTQSGDLDLSSVRLFVLDEADQLCDADNLPTIMKIYEALPKGLGVAGATRLQVCFFSATLHSAQITNLSTAICQNPTWVDLKVWSRCLVVLQAI